jgi:hypothetical protein
MARLSGVTLLPDGTVWIRTVKGGLSVLHLEEKKSLDLVAAFEHTNPAHVGVLPDGRAVGAIHARNRVLPNGQVVRGSREFKLGFFDPDLSARGSGGGLVPLDREGLKALSGRTAPRGGAVLRQN